MCQVKATFSKQNTGESVRLKVGEGVAVELDDLAGAGYRWSFDLPENSPLEAGETKSEPYPGIGGGSRKRMVFCARHPGEMVLDLKLRRPWEKDVAPASDFQLKVSVTQ